MFQEFDGINDSGVLVFKNIITFFFFGGGGGGFFFFFFFLEKIF